MDNQVIEICIPHDLLKELQSICNLIAAQEAAQATNSGYYANRVNAVDLAWRSYMVHKVAMAIMNTNNLWSH